MRRAIVMRSLSFQVLNLTALAGGMILFAQGPSFAGWNKGSSPEGFINHRAGLLALAGVGICCAAAALRAVRRAVVV